MALKASVNCPGCGNNNLVEMDGFSPYNEMEIECSRCDLPLTFDYFISAEGYDVVVHDISGNYGNIDPVDVYCEFCDDSAVLEICAESGNTLVDCVNCGAIISNSWSNYGRELDKPEVIEDGERLAPVPFFRPFYFLSPLFS